MNGSLSLPKLKKESDLCFAMSQFVPAQMSGDSDGLDRASISIEVA
jgi:hypothetical protein